VNKAELVDAIAQDTGLTKRDAQAALNSFIGVVQKQLKKGEDVAITGFGKFSVAKRSARTGRNPQTGEAEDQGLQGPEVLCRGQPEGRRQHQPHEVGRYLRKGDRSAWSRRRLSCVARCKSWPGAMAIK